MLTTHIRPQLHWSQNRHNTTVWTDKEVDINHVTVYVSSYTKTHMTGMLSPNNSRMCDTNKVGLYPADSLARYLLQCA